MVFTVTVQLLQTHFAFWFTLWSPQLGVLIKDENGQSIVRIQSYP